MPYRDRRRIHRAGRRPVHGARSGTGILDGWLIDEGDHADIEGIGVRAVPLLMTDPKATAEMVSAGLDLAGVAA